MVAGEAINLYMARSVPVPFIEGIIRHSSYPMDITTTTIRPMHSVNPPTDPPPVVSSDMVHVGDGPLSAPRRALGDDVDDLERHHYFAGLIDDLDERGDRAAIGL